MLDLDSIDDLSSRAKNNLKPFIDMMNRLMALKEIMGIKDFIEEVINTTGYISELERRTVLRLRQG